MNSGYDLGLAVFADIGRALKIVVGYLGIAQTLVEIAAIEVAVVALVAVAVENFHSPQVVAVVMVVAVVVVAAVEAVAVAMPVVVDAPVVVAAAVAVLVAALPCVLLHIVHKLSLGALMSP